MSQRACFLVFNLPERIFKKFSFVPQVVKKTIAPSVRCKPRSAVDKWDIINIFQLAVRRKCQLELEEFVSTVFGRLEFILSYPSDSFTFTSLFKGVEKVAVNTVIATFLAMLELVRLKRLSLRQDESFGEIFCQRLSEGGAYAIGLNKAVGLEDSED